MFGLRYLKNVSTLELDQEKCTGCRMCTIVCPHAVFTIEHKKVIIVDIDACMECGACARNCPMDAITVNTGVGCAAAVINSKLKGAGECSCGCELEMDEKVSCC